jgi:hypothetical protein
MLIKGPSFLNSWIGCSASLAQASDAEAYMPTHSKLHLELAFGFLQLCPAACQVGSHLSTMLLAAQQLRLAGLLLVLQLQPLLHCRALQQADVTKLSQGPFAAQQHKALAQAGESVQCTWCWHLRGRCCKPTEWTQ